MTVAEDSYTPADLAAARMAAFGQGINLEGDRSDTRPLDAADYAALKAAGFDHVRIVFDAVGTGGPLPANIAALPDVAAVDAKIALAQAAGLKVIVNPIGLNITTRVGTSATEAQEFANWLGAYAKHLSHLPPDQVIFETATEPAYTNPADWKAVEAKLVAALRANAPHHTILASVPIADATGWTVLGGLNGYTPLADPNVIYSVHSYEPFLFTHQGATWTPYSAGVKYLPFAPDAAGIAAAIAASDPAKAAEIAYYGNNVSAASVKTHIAQISDWAATWGVPLALNEFGVINASWVDPADRLLLLSTVSAAAERAGMGWTIWEAVGALGIAVENAAGTLALQPGMSAALGFAGRAMPLMLRLGPTTGDILDPTQNLGLVATAGTAATLSGAQLAAAGTTTGALTYSVGLDGAVTASVTSAWNTVRRIGVSDDSAHRVTLRNFVDATVELGGSGASTVTLTDLKRATVTTGSGGDTIAITAFSNGSSNVAADNSFFIRTEAGNDSITLNGFLTHTRGRIDAGEGNDTVRITGGGIDTVFGRDGNDRIEGGGGNDMLDGGRGTDTAVLSGTRAQYSFALLSDARGTYLQSIGPDGTDVLRNFEYVHFAGQNTTLMAGSLVGNAAPTDIVATLPTIAADLAVGSLVGTLRATDADNASGFTWMLSNSAGGRFMINETTGALHVRATPGAGTHSVGVVVRDAAGNLYQETVLVQAAAQNVAPHAAFLALGQVRENAAAGTLAGRVLGQDANTTDTLRYSLLDNAGGRFTIDAATGALRTTGIGTLDHEVTPWLNIVARVTDLAGAFRDVALKVQVTEVNEAPMNLRLAGQGWVSENATSATLLATLGATDPEGGSVRYALVHDHGGLFRVEATSGKVYLNAGRTLDFETSRTHALAFTATDAQGLSATGSATLNVANVNEAPVISGFASGGSVAPGAVAGTLVGRLAARDPEGQWFTWRLDDSAGGRFVLEANTGELRVGATPLGTASGSFTLAVTATDSGSAAASASVTVAVGTVAPSPAVFSAPTLVFSDQGTFTQQKRADAYVFTPDGAGSVTLSAAQMDILGVVAPQGVVVTTDASGAVTARSSGSFGDVRNVFATSPGPATLVLENFVSTEVALGNGGDSQVTVRQSRLGAISTGDGNDAVSIEAHSTATGDGNTFAVALGAGDDAFTGIAWGSTTRFVVTGGAGDDRLVTGAGADTLDGGAGADQLTGGAGRDVFVLRADEAAGDVITDFAADQIRFEGFGAGATLTSLGGGSFAVVRAGQPAELFSVTGVAALAAGDFLFA